MSTEIAVPDRDPATLGLRLHALRTTRGLTQRELAEPRYTAAYVSSVESGRRMPSGDALTHFADRLGVPATELATGRSPAEAVRADLALTEADRTAAHDPAGAEHVYRLAATGADDPGQVARGWLGLGRLALLQGDPQTAERHFERAEPPEGSPPWLRADATAGRAATLRQRGEHRYAAYLLANTRDDLVRAGLPDPIALLVLHTELAVCHGELGDEDAAASAAEAALSLAGSPDPDHVTALHLTVARTLLDDGQLTAAAIAAEQARQAIRQALLRVELAFCHRARGRGRWTAGDPVGGVADLTIAHDILTSAAATELALDTGVELAEAYRAVGRPDQATPLLNAALTAGGDGPRVARAARVLGMLAADAGDADSAHRHLRAAVARYHRTGPRHELAATTLLLANLLEKRGRADETLDILRTALARVEQLAVETGTGTTTSAR
ncbi:helix-turn-helix domain-containing protein [Polymorphospora lycopeni]|uniref:Helix-turn-helix transcriptional regulator n=1 Tax=Polymorphospora lycopeni TaxID=3140240 RepID=A0ABV5CXR2_9ACTN